jgi:prepilin peptidase dependent protein B
MLTLNRHSGFSLVELLVGMVLGLIVMGGAIFLFSSISLTTSELVKTNRMQQEIREIGLVMTRDIRRAGYSGIVPGEDFNGDGLPNAGQTDPNAVLDAVRLDILLNPHFSSSADIGVYDAPGTGTDDCILFSYNIDADLPAAGTAAVVEDDEWFGYRRQEVDGRGVLQTKMTGASPADCNAGTWLAISADEFDITSLLFAMTTSEIEIENLSGGTVNTCEVNDSCQCIRSVSVDMTVALANNSDISTKMSDLVRIVNDKIVEVRSVNADCHD